MVTAGSRSRWWLPLLAAGCFPVGEITGTFGGPPDEDEDGVSAATDCDDADPNRFPGADERCDGIDNDCDDVVDEDAVDVLTFFRDRDGDGFGTDTTVEACEVPPGFAAQAGDCDDSREVVYPGAPEVCDKLDNDCDRVVDANVVPRDHASIVAALASVPDSAPFTEICVGPGTYQETIHLVGPRQIGITASDGPAVTTFAVAGALPQVTFEGDETQTGVLAVDGFTVSGLDTAADVSGGFLAATAGTVTLRNLRFENHHVTGANVRGLLVRGTNVTLNVEGVVVDGITATTAAAEGDRSGLLVSLEESDLYINGLTVLNLDVRAIGVERRCGLQGAVLQLYEGQAWIGGLTIDGAVVQLDCGWSADTFGTLVRVFRTDLSGSNWTVTGTKLNVTAPIVAEDLLSGNAGALLGLELTGSEQTLDRLVISDNEMVFDVESVDDLDGVFMTQGGGLTLTHVVAHRNRIQAQVEDLTPIPVIHGGGLKRRGAGDAVDRCAIQRHLGERDRGGRGRVRKVARALDRKCDLRRQTCARAAGNPPVVGCTQISPPRPFSVCET